jgi:deazaflavin-dependent oxidoreductase (nitroreductase family)
MPLEGQYAPSTTDWVRDQAEAYEASAGAEAADLRGMPIIVLTTVGAKSGLLRKSPLMRIEHDGEYAIVASNGGSITHPTWYYNVKKNPIVELQDGPTKLDYRAREVHGSEYATWWPRAVAAYPDFSDYIVGLERTIPLFVLTAIPATT